jgi:DNA-binding MarR family transcriptional regulator
VTERARPDAGEQPVKWLTAVEVDSWLSVVRLITWLPWSIDQQLRRDSNLGMVEYQVLARLSQSPEQTMRMSSLADLANASLSRLSHLVKRLEERGLVRREPDPADGRFTNAILTEKGFRTLAEAAPGHVAHVRSLVIDVLSPEQLRRLGRDANRHLRSQLGHLHACRAIGRADPSSTCVTHRHRCGSRPPMYLPGQLSSPAVRTSGRSAASGRPAMT